MVIFYNQEKLLQVGLEHPSGNKAFDLQYVQHVRCTGGNFGASGQPMTGQTLSVSLLHGTKKVCFQYSSFYKTLKDSPIRVFYCFLVFVFISQLFPVPTFSQRNFVLQWQQLMQRCIIFEVLRPSSSECSAIDETSILTTTSRYGGWEQCYHLGRMCLLHIGTQISCNFLHKIKSLKIPSIDGRGDTEPHLQLRSYWHITATGAKGTFLQASGHQLYVHTTLSDSTCVGL